MEHRLAGIEKRLQQLECLPGGRMGEPAHGIETALVLQQLESSVRRLEGMQSKAPTHQDLREHHQRLEQNLHLSFRDIAVAEQRELASVLSEDMLAVKDLIRNHDEAHSQRAMRHFEKINSDRDDDAAVFQKEIQKAVANHQILVTQIDALKIECAALAAGLSEGIKRQQIWCLKRSCRYVATAVLVSATRHWKEIVYSLRIADAQKIAIQKISGVRTRGLLSQTLSKWAHANSFVARRSALCQRAAAALAMWRDSVLERAMKHLFSVWKDLTIVKAHRQERHRLEELVDATSKIETKILLVTAELRCIRLDDIARLDKALELTRAAVRQDLAESAGAAEVAHAAEAQRLGESLRALNEEVLPQMQSHLLSKTAMLQRESEGAFKTNLERLEDSLAETNRASVALEVRVKGAEVAVGRLDDSCAQLSEGQDAALEKIGDTRGQLHHVKRDLASLKERFSAANEEHRERTLALSVELVNTIKASATSLRSENDALRFDFEELFDQVQRIHEPHKPPLGPVAAMCSEYQDLSCLQTFCPPIPDWMAAEVGAWARAMGLYIAETANLEVLERIFLGPRPEDPLRTELSVEERRLQLVTEVKQEVLTECAVSPAPKKFRSAGAPKSQGRDRFVLRLMEAVDVALSRYETVVTLAHTRAGRIKALPTCMACDRPLPMRARADASDAAAAVPGGDNTTPKVAVPPKTKRPVPQHAPSLPLQNTLQAFSNEGPVPSSPSVLRGGFRMPAKPALGSVRAAFMQGTAEDEGFPRVQRPRGGLKISTFP